MNGDSLITYINKLTNENENLTKIYLCSGEDSVTGIKGVYHQINKPLDIKTVKSIFKDFQ